MINNFSFTFHIFQEEFPIHLPIWNINHTLQEIPAWWGVGIEVCLVGYTKTQQKHGKDEEKEHQIYHLKMGRKKVLVNVLKFCTTKLPIKQYMYLCKQSGPRSDWSEQGLIVCYFTKCFKKQLHKKHHLDPNIE